MGPWQHKHMTTHNINNDNHYHTLLQLIHITIGNTRVSVAYYSFYDNIKQYEI